MDCQLPVLDGYQAATEIRRLQAGTRRTPIIAVTAAPMTRERALAAGIDDELTKPFSVKALAAVLARWIPRGSHRTAAHAHAKTLAAIQLGLAEVAEGARPVLDPRVLSGLERLGAAAGEDLVGQLATLFLADAGLRIAGLREALAGHDPAAVAWSAHLLSGASANVGAAELARLCAAFATAGAAGDLTSGSVHLESVEAELDRVRVALRSSVGAP
jgi:HPt (histidine-containing phosphotransfer) domain-containing protein